MNNYKKLSFVIPCYRSENTVLSVVEEIDEVMKTRQGYNYEIILINDCSPDNVWKVIKNLTKNRSDIKAISFVKNFGQHSALLAGYAVIDGDYVISLDDDGQSPVDEVFKLVDKLEEGYDVVYAKYYELKESLWRRFGSWVSDKMTEVLIQKPKEIKGSSYYIMRNYIAKEMVRYKNPYPFVGGLVYRTTKNIANVTVNHRDRIEGKSGYSFAKLLKLWLNGFTAFSVTPLRFSSLVGVICALIGFIFGIITVVRKIAIPDISVGWSSTVAIMLFIGGLIMLMLGMIGEYLGRIYISINNAPQYVIKEMINVEEK